MARKPPKRMPSKEELNSLLSYDPVTGRFLWKERPLSLFPLESRGKSWNVQFSGKEAFTVKNGNGYLCGYVHYEKLYAHRVAWKMVHGEEPDQIDHINGIRSDNRIENLRAVTQTGNSLNLATRSDNSSGVVGVSWVKQARKWDARIRVDGKTVLLGKFANFEDAVAARKEAEAKYGYHPHHGR